MLVGKKLSSSFIFLFLTYIRITVKNKTMKKVNNTAIIGADSEQMVIDKSLATIMQKGNRQEAEAAFQKLFARYKESIFFMAFKFLKNDREASNDMVQEIFVKAWMNKDQYNFTNAYSTWLFKIAKNHLIDEKRKEKFEIFSVDNMRISESKDERTNEFNDIYFQLEDKTANNYQLLVNKERKEAVLSAVNNGITSKGEKIKDVVALYFFEELSEKEVALKLSIPVGTVKTLILRAKEQMKNYLSKKERDFSYAN